MDADGRYIMHSKAIPSIFNSEHGCFNGKNDENLGVLSDGYRRRSKKIHFLSLKNKLRIVTLEINHFESKRYYTPLYITSPFRCDDKLHTLTRIIDICSLRQFSFMTYNDFFNKKKLTDSVLEKPVREFANIKPIIILNESQWDALWLCLMRYSYREISRMTGRN